MNSFMNNPTSLSGWYSLIKDACKSSDINLPEEIESYLVFLLMRFIDQPEIVKAVLANEYLEGLNKQLQLREVLLKDVGDKCLIISGLFPARAQKKRLKISYFVKLGQHAYSALGHLSTKEQSAIFYGALSEKFVAMMDILQTARQLDSKTPPQLNAFEAYDLWNDTNSAYARKTFELYSNFQPIRDLLKRMN